MFSQLLLRNCALRAKLGVSRTSALLFSSSSRNVQKFNTRILLLIGGGGFSAGAFAFGKFLLSNNVGVVYSRDNTIEQAATSEVVDEKIEDEEDKDLESSFFGVPWSFWNEIFEICKGQFWILAVAIISASASAYFNIKISVQLGELIDIVSRHIPASNDVSQERTTNLSLLASEVVKPITKLLISYFAQASTTLSYITAMSYFGEYLGVELRVKLFKKLLLMDAEYFDSHHRIGDLMGSITNDTQQFKSAFKHIVGQGLKNSVQMIGFSVSLVMISPTLAASLGAPLIGMVFVGSAIGKQLRQMSHEAQSHLGKATAMASEGLYGVNTVRAFAAEKEQTDRYASQLRYRFLNSATSLGAGIGLLQGLSNLAINGMVVGVVFLGGWQISTGNLSPGELMSFLMASQSLQRCMAQTSVLVSDVIKGCSAASRMSDVLNLQSSIPYAGGRKAPFHSIVGDIEFKDVFLTYKTHREEAFSEDERDHEQDRQSALNGINLSIPGGSIVAITGPSGAGKSSVAGLMERFYDPTSGSIFLDKIDLRLYDLYWLRHRAIGYVGQEPVLFAGSVSENIRFGKPEATDQEIEEAARAAQAHDFISQDLPKGYDSIIGERGVSLSGGQKQRIALARALIKDPPILVLDEITSALDAESERAIHRALEQRSPHGRTIIMVTHRLNWARTANKIVVVNKGQVVEEGSHDSLLSKRGVYYKLWFQQNKK